MLAKRRALSNALSNALLFVGLLVGILPEKVDAGLMDEGSCSHSEFRSHGHAAVPLEKVSDQLRPPSFGVVGL